MIDKKHLEVASCWPENMFVARGWYAIEEFVIWVNFAYIVC